MLTHALLHYFHMFEKIRISSLSLVVCSKKFRLVFFSFHLVLAFLPHFCFLGYLPLVSSLWPYNLSLHQLLLLFSRVCHPPALLSRCLIDTRLLNFLILLLLVSLLNTFTGLDTSIW